MTTHTMPGYRGFDFDRPEVERDAFPLRVHGGTIIVAGAWLVFYVIAILQHLVTLGN